MMWAGDEGREGGGVGGEMWGSGKEGREGEGTRGSEEGRDDRIGGAEGKTGRI